jgi:hypothetical protein
MTLAYWFTHNDRSGFPLERAALRSCDLSVCYVDGEWQWLVQHAGQDLAEGAARASLEARRQAEATAVMIGAAQSY